MCIDAQNTRNVVIETTKKKRRLALIDRDKSLASKFAKDVGISSNIILRKLEVIENLNHVGVNALMQIRTNTFMYTNNYIRANKLEPIWLNKCFFCEEEEKDDAWHMLMTCKTFSEERKILLIKTELLNINNIDKNKILGSLLVGERAVCLQDKRTHAIVHTVEYMARVVPRRLALVASRRITAASSPP